MKIKTKIPNLQVAVLRKKWKSNNVEYVFFKGGKDLKSVNSPSTLRQWEKKEQSKFKAN